MISTSETTQPSATPRQQWGGLPNFSVAPLSIRLASAGYELLVLVALAIVLGLLPMVALAWASHWLIHPYLLWLWIVAVWSAYYVRLWSRHGQTLAMQAWRLRLVDGHSLQPIGQGKAWRRFCWAIISWGMGGLGIVWAMIDKDRQFLHDRLAGTLLLRHSKNNPTTA